MNTETIYSEEKSFTAGSGDLVEIKFTAVRVQNNGYGEHYDVTTYLGTIRAGEWEYGETYTSNKVLNKADYLHSVNTTGVLRHELVRAAIKECDKWFGECHIRLVDAGLIAIGELFK